ncbi:MAG: hypothetical protein LBH04_08380 [Tannerellaceae bacterium]|jgi:hypothetical protein|nr:hypothetical protein [Tannerellaceae bacterium]
MKTYHLIPVILSLLISCTPDNLVENEKTEEKIPKTYMYEKIQYVYDEGDIIKEYRKERPLIEFNNNTSVTQKYIYDASRNMQECSFFTSDEPYIFSLLPDSIMVNIPSYLSEPDAINIDDKRDWLFSSDSQTQIQSSAPVSKSEVTIPPQTRIFIYPTLIIKEFSLSYILTVRETHTGNIKLVRGKWKGALLAGHELEIK